MKYLLIGATAAIVIRGPADEFEARRLELQRDHVGRLTDLW